MATNDRKHHVCTRRYRLRPGLSPPVGDGDDPLFSCGVFLTSLNDILIPHLKSVFDLTTRRPCSSSSRSSTSYFVFSLPSGKLIDAVGYKRAMVAGLFTMGFGALLFIPAASVSLVSLLSHGVDRSRSRHDHSASLANPYVAILGPEKRRQPSQSRASIQFAGNHPSALNSAAC